MTRRGGWGEASYKWGGGFANLNNRWRFGAPTLSHFSRIGDEQFPWLQEGDEEDDFLRNRTTSNGISKGLQGQGIDEETQTEKILQASSFLHSIPKKSCTCSRCLAP